MIEIPMGIIQQEILDETYELFKDDMCGYIKASMMVRKAFNKIINYKEEVVINDIPDWK